MIAILKKDLKTYLGSGIAWVILSIYNTICALFLFFFENNFNLFDIGTASMQPYFMLAPWILMFILPALSMKSFAEEQQNGTLYWLFAQPIRIPQLILGKFFAVYIVGLLCLLPSLVYAYILSTLGVPEGNMDYGMTFGGYIGLAILIAAFSSIGLLTSSLSSSQIIAYLMGVFSNFIFYFGIEQLASYKLLGSADYWLQNLGFYYHYTTFTRGLIDSRDICYFSFICLMSLAGAYFSINKKKSI